jgi:hypothetical protein
MAIPGLQVINIGVQNESIGSDSLFTAFSKTKDNFSNLFTNSSPYNTFTGNTGIGVTANSTLGTVNITNTGVTSLTAGDSSVTLSSSNGAITITAAGGGNGGGVSSVGVLTASSSRLTTTGGPIISSGNITLDLATTGVTAATYTYPTLTVDAYGRVTSISNAASVGTVTSVGITPGFGIQVTGSPITTAGNITILNTGVTRLSAGTGISLSGSNGNITVSTAASSGTVTSVAVTSSSLTVSGSPIVTAGTISVELSSNVAVGNVTANSTGGMGYATGAGGTVTQGTSRTTGVTVNKPTGSITLVSAAGTSAYTTFIVTNSTVAATDVIIINQKSGTDRYTAWISNVAAGSFSVTFSDVTGTTTEQPVFNFAVIKGVTS